MAIGAAHLTAFDMHPGVVSGRCPQFLTVATRGLASVVVQNAS